MGTTAMDEKSSSSGGGGEGGGSGKAQTQEENPVRDHHPWDYHVSGPRDLASPHWRDLICSSWYVPIKPSSSSLYRYRYNNYLNALVYWL